MKFINAIGVSLGIMPMRKRVRDPLMTVMFLHMEFEVANLMKKNIREVSIDIFHSF